MSFHIVSEGKEPSRITLSFYEQLEGDELELKVSMIYNAICLLSTASNLKVIEFSYNEQHMELDRISLEEWYGCKLNDQLTEYMIIKRMEKILEDGTELPL